jgi:hypothetical protein
MSGPRSLRAPAAVALAAALLLGALAAPIQAQTVAALWHMDAVGTMVDSSGNGNDGSLTDVTLVSPGVDGAGAAYGFNGTSSSVVVPDDDTLDPGSLDISVTVHVNFSTLPDDTVGDYDLIRKKKAGTAYKMEILKGGRPFCLFRGALARKSISLRRNLADGVWHTITCAKTSDTVSLIVDGRTKSRAIAVGDIANPGPVIIGGKEGATGDWYLGLMDEVSITIG